MVAVHIAKGSTVIADWLPGTEGYEIIKQKSLAAIKKARNEFEVDKVYFVWLQGESDAICSNSRRYYKDKLADNLIHDIGIEKFGIIRVGRFNGDARDDEIIDAQTEICREDENFVLLTDMISEMDEKCGFFNPYVKGHLSAKGCESVGQAAGEALALERLNAAEA